MTEKTTIIPQQLALLVLDMQPAFLKAIHGHEHVLRRTRFAIEVAHALGIKIVFTEQVPEKLGHTDPDLLAAAGENYVCFEKSAFSALRCEDFEAWIKGNGVEHLLLTGIEIPICIYQTCVDAPAMDIDITVFSDCVTGRRLDDCQNVAQALKSHGTHWLPAETVFYSLISDAQSSYFKILTKLVKAYTQ